MAMKLSTFVVNVSENVMTNFHDNHVTSVYSTDQNDQKISKNHAFFTQKKRDAINLGHNLENHQSCLYFTD